MKLRRIGKKEGGKYGLRQVIEEEGFSLKVGGDRRI